jgi:hypothetical protein
MHTQQPEALRLIQHMKDEWPEDWDQSAIKAELRRLHEVNADLLEALKLAVRQNSHDMLMTGEELRKCEAAIAKATGAA